MTSPKNRTPLRRFRRYLERWIVSLSVLPTVLLLSWYCANRSGK